MNFTDVQAQLNDLPSTFKRPGAPYTQIVDAWTTALTLFTAGVDGTVSQQVFANALDGWIDCWGLLFGIQRQPNEANASYSARISETVLAWVGTLPAMQVWINLFAPGGSISENLPNLGYNLTLPPHLTYSQISYFLKTLAWIRPAGVPFTLVTFIDDLYLGTINFLGEGLMPGSYLSTDSNLLLDLIGPTTNSAQPLLPDLYFTDPTLNA